jgi:DNA-binding PadR family transcriptional regulator
MRGLRTRSAGGSARSARQPNERRAAAAAVLLLLGQAPTHGYELWALLETVMPAAEPPPNPGTLYRLLHRLEAEGAVTSDWEQSSGGPRRRVYAITERGRAQLDDCAGWIERDATAARRFLRTYRATQSRSGTRTTVAGSGPASPQPTIEQRA